MDTSVTLSDPTWVDRINYVRDNGLGERTFHNKAFHDVPSAPGSVDTCCRIGCGFVFALEVFNELDHALDTLLRDEEVVHSNHRNCGTRAAFVADAASSAKDAVFAPCPEGTWATRCSAT